MVCFLGESSGVGRGLRNGNSGKIKEKHYEKKKKNNRGSIALCSCQKVALSLLLVILDLLLSHYCT